MDKNQQQKNELLNGFAQIEKALKEGKIIVKKIPPVLQCLGTHLGLTKSQIKLVYLILVLPTETKEKNHA